MLLVANWKAYVDSPKKAKELFTQAKNLSLNKKHRIVIAPPAPYLGLFAQENASKVLLASQDLSVRTGGAHTGETTAEILSGMKVTYVIVGHSERRAMGETDAIVARKVKLALSHGLVPIVCIGEQERDVDAKYLQVLRSQIESVFSKLPQKERSKVIIAYEPVWAIGKSAHEAVTPTDLQEMVLYIRKILSEYVPPRTVVKMNMLYGGSVEAANAKSLASESGVDGFLVGHASSNPKTFSALVKQLS
jgi:triosephosphate isomerase